jgi:hypothetical protein
MKRLFYMIMLGCATAWAKGPDISVKPLGKISSSYGPVNPKGGGHCTGKIKSKMLAPFPWAQKALAAGVDCIAGDFDGDGTQDFLLLKNGWSTGAGGTKGSEAVALMYGPKGLEKAIAVKGITRLLTFELYPPRAKAGQFGEPVTKHPGFEQWGDGKKTTIWLFANGTFAPQQFDSETD